MPDTRERTDTERLDFLECRADVMKYHDNKILLLGAWTVNESDLRAAIDFQMEAENA